MLRWIKWTIIGLAGAILLAFVLSNSGRATLSFFPLPYEMTLPLFVILFFAIVFGMVLGKTIGNQQNLQLKRQVRELELRLHAIEKEAAAKKASDTVQHHVLQLEKKI